MHPIIAPLRPASRLRPSVPKVRPVYRHPNYDCREQSGTVKLLVYAPGVNASGVEIEVRGTDLIITARKSRSVRANWSSMQLERVQKDYQLRLRLGRALDYGRMETTVSGGILTVTLPKRTPGVVAGLLERVV